ncbi:hypothetical protein PG990_010641 [Apiospora arundinis]
MFSSSLLLALFAGIATSLPNDISARITKVVAGNPFTPECKLDGCLLQVVAADQPTPSKALQACSSLLQTTVTPSSTYTSTSTVTASEAPVTVTVTQTQPVPSTTVVTANELGTSIVTTVVTLTTTQATSTTTNLVKATTTTTVDVSSTIIDTVGETDTVTATSKTTSTSIETSRVTVTGLDVTSTTATETSTSVQTDFTTTTVTQVPQKRDVPKKGRCRNSQLLSVSSLPAPTTSSSVPTTSSSVLSVASGCANAAQYASACSCAYVTPSTSTAAAPTVVTTVTETQKVNQVTVTATVVTSILFTETTTVRSTTARTEIDTTTIGETALVTETLLTTDVVTETDVHSTTQTSTATTFVTTTTQVTDVVPTTTVQTVPATLSSTKTTTQTVVVGSTTVSTVVETVLATGPRCPRPPPSCAQPTFYLQVASGSPSGGLWVYVPPVTNPLYNYAATVLRTINVAAKASATTFTIDAEGVLFSLKYNSRVYYQAVNPTSGYLAIFSNGKGPMGAAAVNAWQPFYAQNTCAPTCPLTSSSSSGPLLISEMGKTGTYNSFGLCNGVPSTSKDGSDAGWCSDHPLIVGRVRVVRVEGGRVVLHRAIAVVPVVSNAQLGISGQHPLPVGGRTGAVDDKLTYPSHCQAEIVHSALLVFLSKAPRLEFLVIWILIPQMNGQVFERGSKVRVVQPMGQSRPDLASVRHEASPGHRQSPIQLLDGSEGARQCHKRARVDSRRAFGTKDKLGYTRDLW